MLGGEPIVSRRLIHVIILRGGSFIGHLSEPLNLSAARGMDLAEYFQLYVNWASVILRKLVGGETEIGSFIEVTVNLEGYL